MPGDEDSLTAPWEGDVNEAVVEEWTNETTAFDRLTSVIDATTEPALARELAERARVSEPTVRKHVSSLAEVGRVTVIQTEEGAKYKRSATTLAMQRISALHARYTKAELHDGLRDLRGEIQRLRDKHDAEDPDDLARKLESPSAEWGDLARWRDLEENLDILKAALDLYDFDPDDEAAAGVARDGEGSEDDSRTALAGFGPVTG